MKHKKGRGRSSDIESSEDERIIDDPMNDFIVEGEGREEGNESGEDLFENSQDLSQVIPRRIKAEKSPAGSTSPRKKKDKSRKEPTPTPRTTKSRPPTATAPTSSRQINGVRVREVDISEVQKITDKAFCIQIIHQIKHLNVILQTLKMCVDSGASYFKHEPG